MGQRIESILGGFSGCRREPSRPGTTQNFNPFGYSPPPPAGPTPRPPGGRVQLYELSDIARAANSWNKGSPGSSSSPYYQCEEQATQLMLWLQRSKKPWKYWGFRVISRYWGGSTQIGPVGIGSWQTGSVEMGVIFTANAIEVYPINGNPELPVVIYPWKILPGPSPAKCYSQANWYHMYPHKLPGSP